MSDEFTANDLHVLYEDNHVIAVAKPAGVLSQGDRTGDRSILDVVKAYLKDKYNKPGNVFLGLVHRLDRPASGVMVFARTSKAASRLSDAFRRRDTEKTYRVLVERTPQPAHGTLTHWIEPGKRGQASVAWPQPQDNAKQAVLHYHTLGTRNGFAELEIVLETGRKHQIRAQLAALDLPVVGDKRYGSRVPRSWDGIGLHAYRLAVPHPTKTETIEVVAPPPWETATA